MLFLFRFLALWPLRLLHALGAAMGWGVWCLSPRYRAAFRANVAQAGVPFALARPAIAEAGRFVAELPKNHYGKVLKTTLREWDAQHAA